jgi:prepilin-type N-terminal cleavage/methylation domain-containing protein
MRQTTNRNGFTLVELVIVMMLVGIMAGIVIPLLRPQGFQLDTAVVSVSSAVMAQQRNAVLRQHDVVLAFDTVNELIRVHYDTNNNGKIDSGESWHVVQLEEGVRFGLAGAPVRPSGSGPLSFTEEEDDMPALTFRRNGSASEEGVIYLTSARAAGEAFPEDTRAVEVERATGRTRCYSYASGAWMQKC